MKRSLLIVALFVLPAVASAVAYQAAARERDYRALLAQMASPKSKSAPRYQEILSIDFASDTQACAKVSVRIPIIVPGVGDDSLRASRSATLPGTSGS